MSNKKKITKPEDIDIARFAFGAYRSYGKKIASKDGDEYFGQVNPCIYGEQCGHHACYCNHKDGWRKCHNSWYTGGGEPDENCPLYKSNPYWKNVSKEFYKNREATIKNLREKGKLEEKND